MKRTATVAGLILALGLTGCADEASTPLAPGESLAASASGGNTRISVGLNTDATDAILAELATLGNVGDQIQAIDIVVLQGSEKDLPAIRRLPYVAFAEVDREVGTGPRDAVLATDFTGGLSTWNLDAINVTSGPGFNNRAVAQTGAGVYVGVLDTGLTHNWRLYFPEERIATQYAVAFSGGPTATAATPEAGNQWEADVNSHGTHVTSTIIGYNLNGTRVSGVAPRATVIPVKVLGQTGRGWTTMVAKGIAYIADLKAGELSGSPVVINMSLGGGASATKDRAVDYAIANGVVIVAAAGNNGGESYDGMGYPGAYEPVISVGSAGWGDCDVSDGTVTLADCYGQWIVGSWWNSRDVAESWKGGYADQFYSSDFSSREHSGQDLDVIAPGHWIVGPYDVTSSAQTSYFYLSGTSMASPHVAGIVALMMEKDPSLTASRVETILEGAAYPMAPGTHHPLAPGPACCFEYTWNANATGSGFITADAALAALDGGGRKPKGK
jgi:subtilisin family serine protease